MNIKHITSRLAAWHLSSCTLTPCDCGAAVCPATGLREDVTPIIKFPPMPPAVVQHETLGPLYDGLAMQFFAAKHAEALTQLLDVAYQVDLPPRAAPAQGPVTNPTGNADKGSRHG